MSSELTMDRWWTRTWNRIMGSIEMGKVKDEDTGAVVWAMKESPRNYTEQKVMRKASAELSDVIGLKPSQLQAVLWYYEQSLWAAHGADNEAVSYSEAARRYLAERNIPYEERKRLQPQREVPTDNRGASEPGDHALSGGIPGSGSVNTGKALQGPESEGELGRPPINPATELQPGELEGYGALSGLEDPNFVPFAASGKPGLKRDPYLEATFKKLPKTITASGLGEPTKTFDFNGGWIMPNGQVVKFNQFHYSSLAMATGISQNKVIPYQQQIAAHYGLVRLRVGSKGDAGVEVYGVPTAAQMLSISKMQKAFDNGIIYNITDASSGDVVKYGKGSSQLRRDIDEHFNLNGMDLNSETGKPPLAEEEFFGLKTSPPKKIVVAYKLFRIDPKRPGELFPLFVNSSRPVPVGEWRPASAGPMDANRKVKSKLGGLAYRPGWHASDYPVATHIGGKSTKESNVPDYRPRDQVWAEVELPDDVDWQRRADTLAKKTKEGKVIPSTAQITDQVPVGGHYRYKTSPNMTGNWIIAGSMKVRRVLLDEEVRSINERAGLSDLPRNEEHPYFSNENLRNQRTQAHIDRVESEGFEYTHGGEGASYFRNSKTGKIAIVDRNGISYHDPTPDLPGDLESNTTGGHPIFAALPPAQGPVPFSSRKSGWAEAWRWTFNPPGRGTEAKIASGSLREHGAVRDLKSLRATERMNEAHEFFRWKPVQDTRDFIDAIENAQPQAMPTGRPSLMARAAFRLASGLKKGVGSVDATQLDNWGAEMRAMLNQRVAEVQGLGTGKLQSVYANYFPHLWKDPRRAQGFYDNWYGTSPFEGSKSFLKKRTHPTMADGLAAGLEPVSENPTELLMLKLREMDRYIAAHRVMADLEKNHLLARVSDPGRPPSGYEKIDDRIGKRYTKTASGGMAVESETYAPEPVATVINNYLSPGIRGTPWKNPFEAGRWIGNLLNMAQLGASGFHLTFTAGDAVISAASTALLRASKGNFSGSIKSVMGLPLRPITAFREGQKILHAALSGTPQSAQLRDMINMALKGGAGFKMDSFYDTGVYGSFLNSLAQGTLKGAATAAVKIPALIMEASSRPVLDYLVPRMKLGVMADMMRYEMENLPPNYTDEQLREIAGKVVDSVDNRMGQLRYDNLGWNKVTKDLAMISVRSVGWNLGTFREFGGAAYDSVAGAKEAAKRISQGKMPNLTHKQGYTIMAPVVMAVIGAIYMYMHTGEFPKDFRDYYYPETGRITPNGERERVALPSYMKDIYAYSKKPLVTLSHKVHPLFNMISDLLIRNEDYYGNMIRQTDDGLWAQLYDAAKYIGNSFMPFSFRNVEQRNKSSYPTDDKGQVVTGPFKGLEGFESFFGAVPAPSSISKTAAEERMDQHIGERIPKGSRTEIEKQRREEVQALTKTYREQGVEGAQAAISQSSVLRQKDLRYIAKKSGLTKLTYGATRLPIEDVLDVYSLASDEEKQELTPIIQKKLRTVHTKSKAEQEKILQTIDKLGLRSTLFGDKLPEPPPQ
jgi:hypothetical protein